MSNNQSYFQFPLCLLAYGPNPTERLNLAINFTCRNVGTDATAKATPETKAQWVRLFSDAEKSIYSFDQKNPLHQRLWIGGEQVGVRYNGVDRIETELKEFDHFYANFRKRHGQDAFVRLRKDLVFEARDAKGMSYRELSVLAAILSVIGQKREPVQITLETIRRRALGYRNAAIEGAEFKFRKDTAVSLTRSQLRTIIGSLERRKFFARFTFGRRRTFYGLGQTAEAFRKSIIHKLVKKQVAETGAKLTQEALTQEIRRLRLGTESDLQARLARPESAPVTSRAPARQDGGLQPKRATL